ncbi:restriction endonuclease subunit M [Gordonia sp. FQ]|uniref:restriction endonuclease subunit M n=1 Tax=Gordonia sp. FQ TaxID=3446634 RepID=UPI003F853125
MPAIGDFVHIPPADWLFPTHGDVRDGRRRAEAYYSRHGTYEGAEYEIEEFVRQWALSALLTEYKYPREWVGERVVIEYPVKMGSTTKEADIALLNTERRPFLYIEVKKRRVKADEFDEGEKQLETYLASTHTATIGMITDGERIRSVRKKIDPNDFEYISDIPANGLTAAVRTKLVRELPVDGDSRATGLRQLNNEYERLLFACHSEVRDIDGLHSDEALDEICKVLYTKMYDERATTKKSVGEPFRFQTYGASNSSEVASTIRSLYEESRESEIELYSQRIPGYARSRGVFNSRIRLSDIALYSVVEQLQDFSLVDSGADIKGRAFQKVLGPAIRAGMGQYFTPDPIVRLAVGIVSPTAEDLILDPFCGSGHFLTNALQYVVDSQGDTLSEHALHEFKFFHLHGIEKSDRMVRIAMTDMMLHDDGHTNVRNMDSLLSFDNYPDITALRDDGNVDPAVFSVILTNPPFGSTVKAEAAAMLGRFELGAKKKNLPLEVLGLERSIQFLRPGGRMAIVLPEHIIKGKSTRYVRDWLQNVAHIRAIFSFPEEAFTPYGAMVKTCLLILQKLNEGEVPSGEDATLLCELENLGYDATNRPKPGSEVHEAVAAFHESAGWL